MSERPTGTLWLVPNTLDLGSGPPETLPPLADVLPLGVIRRAAALAHWVAEDAKTARAFLKRVDAVAPLARPLQQIAIRELPRPQKGGSAPRGGAGGSATGEAAAWRDLLAPALAGDDLGLISEAGLPAVADPGAALVAAAHAAGVPVVPLPGPSSLLLALAASGCNGQRFAFVGYLPQDAAARAQRLRELEARARRDGEAQICIETPYRNAAWLQAALQVLAPTTRLAVACGLTLTGGFTRSDPVAAWRAKPVALPDRLPAVFTIGG